MLSIGALGLVTLALAAGLGSPVHSPDSVVVADGGECHVITVTVPPYEPTVTFCPPVR